MKIEAKNKPVLKVEIIEREYWQCNITSHRHMSESAASKCMAKLSGKGHVMSSPNWQRNITVIKRVIEGEEVVRVAESIGVSGPRLRQITAQYLRRMHKLYNDDPLYKKAEEEFLLSGYQIFGQTLSDFRERREFIVYLLDRYEVDLKSADAKDA